jgi:hypothetical protein
MFDRRTESGMNTAEYAVGTLAACGFAGVLYLLCDYYDDTLRSVLGLALQQVKYLWPRLW